MMDDTQTDGVNPTTDTPVAEPMPEATPDAPVEGAEETPAA